MSSRVVTSRFANASRYARKRSASAGANGVSVETRGQVIALGRLGWSLRRIEETTGVRRETASAYLKAVGLAVRARAADGAAAKTGHRGVDRPRAGGEQRRPGGVDRVGRPDAILYLLAQSLLDLASDHLMGTAT